MRLLLSLSAALLLAPLICSQALAAQDTPEGKGSMVMAFSEFPPFKMVLDGTPSGVDVDLAAMVAQRMGLTLEIRECTFADCLELLRRGDVDFITSLLRRGDRDDYLVYVQPRYRNRESKGFYMRPGEEARVKTYGDLGALRIGVKEGVAYAQMFDTDATLTKVEAATMYQLFRMLMDKEADAVLASRHEGDFWVKVLELEDRVARAPFSFEQLDPVYMAISKKSPLAGRAGEFGRVLNDLVEKGEFERLLESYMDRAGEVAKEFGGLK